MEGDVFATYLSNAGFHVVIPEEDERQELQRLIFDELTQGIVLRARGLRFSRSRRPVEGGVARLSVFAAPSLDCSLMSPPLPFQSLIQRRRTCELSWQGRSLTRHDKSRAGVTGAALGFRYCVIN